MAQTVTRKAVFAVVSFTKTRGGVAIDKPVQARGEAEALRLAERLSADHLGAIAFSRTGDPEVGEFDDPVLLAKFGEVPYTLDELMA